MVRECRMAHNADTASLPGKAKAPGVAAFSYALPKVCVGHQLIRNVLRHNSSSGLTKNPYNTMTFFSSRKGLQESEARFYLHAHKSTQCMYTHDHETVCLTAQIERLVQAFFNMAPTPDISFVSVIIHRICCWWKMPKPFFSVPLHCSPEQSLPVPPAHRTRPPHPQLQPHRSQRVLQAKRIFTQNLLPAAAPHL